MLAVHPSIKPKVDRSSKKNLKKPVDGNLLKKGEMLAVHQSNRKSIIHQGKRGKWRQDGNLLEGEEMLAVHQSHRKSIIHQGKMKNGRRIETS